MAEYIIDGKEYMEGFVGDPIRFNRELVRCKDCKYLNEELVKRCGTYKCENAERYVTPMFFCADGEPKEQT